MKKHLEAAKKTSRASNEFRLGQVKTGKLALSLMNNLKDSITKMIKKDNDIPSKNECFDEIVKKSDGDVNKYDICCVDSI